MKREASDMSIVNQMSAETPPLKLCDEPFVDFLGFREEMQHGEIQYFMDFRDSHIGNPMIGTFHGGILASFGEVAAAAYLARQRGDNERITKVHKVLYFSMLHFLTKT
jgi:acyl-coenzyme A thioesterase PaaI-like protein